MFDFVIVTNCALQSITDTIEILKSTISDSDKITVVNYNRSSIEYRSTKGITYIHTKKSRVQAINENLPKDSNVVLLSGDFLVSKSFVKNLYKDYDPEKLHTLRVDGSSRGGKVITSDERVGTPIHPSSFRHIAVVLNTGILSYVANSVKETAEIAKDMGMELNLLSRVRVTTPKDRHRVAKDKGMMFIVPSQVYEYADDIRDELWANDRLYCIGTSNLTRSINRRISESSNDCIVLINPRSGIKGKGMVTHIRRSFDPNKCIRYDTHGRISDDAWLVLPKKMFIFGNVMVNDISQLQASILEYGGDYILNIKEKQGAVIPTQPPLKIHWNNGW